jgi:hypothetical protein
MQKGEIKWKGCLAPMMAGFMKGMSEDDKKR